MKRGQYVRLLLSTTANPSTVVAAAKQMGLHGSAQTEDSSTRTPRVTLSNMMSWD